MTNNIKNKKKYSIEYYLLLITIFFNIVFPKAGIKIADIPITIGNILFSITFVVWIFRKIKNKIIKLDRISLILFIGIIYFIIKYLIIFINLNSLTSFTISFIVTLTIYPLIFFVAHDILDSKEKIENCFKIIYYGFIFITLYSLAQFLFGIEKLTIPGLTVNLTDYMTMGSKWFMMKSNGTDISNTKIVSTYQNGNILGINLILMYPIIYFVLKENNNFKKIVFTLLLFLSSSFLTLSRTCWLGIILFLFFGLIFEKNKEKKSILFKLFIIILFVISIIFIFKYMPSVANRFLNTSPSDWVSMSGRTEAMFKVLTQLFNSGNLISYIIGPLGTTKFDITGYEMLPISLLAQTGIIGIILLYSFFFNFIIIKPNNSITKGAKLAIIIWLIIGCIECGYWLTPTALNLFIIIAMGYNRNYLETENCL